MLGTAIRGPAQRKCPLFPPRTPSPILFISEIPNMGAKCFSTSNNLLMIPVAERRNDGGCDILR